MTASSDRARCLPAASGSAADAGCGSVDAAPWVAKRPAATGGFFTDRGTAYWVWRRRVDCDWAQQKAAFLTHALGTKYMRLADLGPFRCRILPPPKDVVWLRPRTAYGVCLNTKANSVARFEWRPAIPRF